MPILRVIEVLMPVAAVIAAVLLRRIATTETPDTAPAGQNQPECTRCGATEINWVTAVCVPRWARVQSRLLCPSCLHGFLEWMRDYRI